MRTRRSVPLLLLLTSVCLCTPACGHRDAPAKTAAAAAPASTTSASPPAASAADDDKGEALQVTLSAEERERAGIVTAAAAPLDIGSSATGFGSVVSHEQIAQAVADLAVAEATLRQSRTILARMHKLAGTPGADTVEALEGAERQAANDEAAAVLARNKSSLVLGTHSPWANGGSRPVLDALAAGRSQLVRATFPLGALHAEPHALQASGLDAAPTDAPANSTTVWAAPADPALPGRSYFALFTHPKFREGERVIVTAKDGHTAADSDDDADKDDDKTRSVFIPGSALLVTQGGYWCYIEHESGHFTRIAVKLGKPHGDGYVVDDGVEPGDRLVIAGAGLLLARETGGTSGGD